MGAFDGYVALSEYFGVREVMDAVSIGGFINSTSPATAAHTAILWLDLA